jgi:hypothetical protein
MDMPLRHLVPFDNENQWSNLLAVLIEWDPHVAATAFDWPEAEVVASREARAEGRDRVDLLVHAGDALVGVIEVKVLSGLGATVGALPTSPARCHELCCGLPASTARQRPKWLEVHHVGGPAGGLHAQ